MLTTRLAYKLAEFTLMGFMCGTSTKDYGDHKEDSGDHKEDYGDHKQLADLPFPPQHFRFYSQEEKCYTLADTSNFSNHYTIATIYDVAIYLCTQRGDGIFTKI
uniref:Uncharacterized protein n=1 Tax=Glossina pallidipes TaxID=7398 RepID=A0A1A9ZXE0_GLOPL